MMELNLDIPSLIDEGIHLGSMAFGEVRELHSSSMIDWLILIEMLILLIDSFDKGVIYHRQIVVQYPSELNLFVNSEVEGLLLGLLWNTINTS